MISWSLFGIMIYRPTTFVIESISCSANHVDAGPASVVKLGYCSVVSLSEKQVKDVYRLSSATSLPPYLLCRIMIVK